MSSVSPHAGAPGARATEWSWPLAPQLAQAALQHAPTVIYVYDVQTEKSLFQNRRFGDLLGYADDGGNDWRRYIHEEDALAFPEHRQRLKSIKRGEVLTWTFRMRHADGEWHHFVSRDVLLEADEHGAPKLIVGHASNINEQKSAEERKNLLIGEMRHRARNLVTLIDAIGRQSMPRGDANIAQFFDKFMGRMKALLETADTVLSSERRMADLRNVADAALAPFTAPATPRIHVSGPQVLMGEHAAGNLALVLHELATNATKYGALSAPEGSVALSWTVAGPDDRPQIAIEWWEQGGPPVAQPLRQGYGTRVIKNALRGNDSDVALDFNPAGVRCRIRFTLPAPG